MEGVPFDWNDYLSAEGFSDIVPTELGMHADQAGQVGLGPCFGRPATDLDSLGNHAAVRMIQTGDAAEYSSTPNDAWHKQQLASQQKFYNADESQGYDVAGRIHLDREEDLPGIDLNNDAIASQDQYWHHGRMTYPEISEARFEPVPPQPAPSLFNSQTEIGQDDSTPQLEALVPDQVCTCATCLFESKCPEHLRGLARHPETESWTFGCRVTGCRWTTKDDSGLYSDRNVLERLLNHERYLGREDHYGKPGEWRCREAGCKFVTKRWSDFTRHSSSKHCVKPKNFECPVLSCKFHQLGFTRKDKLKSHFDKVHRGNSQPGKPYQAIKPKGKDSD